MRKTPLLHAPDPGAAAEAAAEEARLAATGAPEEAGECEDLLLAAESSRERGLLLWRQKRGRETLAALSAAHRLLDRLVARRCPGDAGARMTELEAELEEVVRLWGESIEAADHHTQGHCARVADHACLLARAFGFDERTLFWLRLGGYLHDVGKIIVPAELLNKPGGLTPAERLLVERHPDAGVELLAEAEFPWDIRPMVRFHHERFGGGGYPTGIAGEAIPVAARILAIADVFDALSTDRPYRRAFPPERCLEIMRHEMAGFFDPALLSLWEALLARGEVRAAAWAGPGGGAGEAGPAGPRPMRLLCIPDRVRGVEGWGGRLAESAGAALTLCGSLADAVGLLDEARYDACLLEVVEAGGHEVATVARVREEFPEMALLVVGLRRDESCVLPLIQAGAHEVLHRHQLSPEELRHAVHRAIERNRIQRELHDRSTIDELTGVHNRRGFRAEARRRMAAAARAGRELFLVFADVDGMKAINDGCGHAEGDRALVELAELLRRSFRSTDVVARLGGDEFVVLLRESAGVSAPLVRRRLESRLAEAARRSGRPYALRVSIGVTRWEPGSASTLEDLLAEADRMMYARKRRRGGEGRTDPAPPPSGGSAQ